MNRFTRLFPIAASLLGGALIFGCSDETTAPSGPDFAVAPPSETVEFTTCKPQPYAVASAWIGPKGGILKAGNHRLWVPAGALSKTTWITMETPSGSLNRVVFGPEGLTFNNQYPAHLLMSYQNCTVPPGTGQGIAYVNNSLRIIEITPSDNQQASLTVDARLLHFSEYVLLSTYAVVY